jgi:hypothetical protein
LVHDRTDAISYFVSSETVDAWSWTRCCPGVGRATGKPIENQIPTVDAIYASLRTKTT